MKRAAVALLITMGLAGFAALREPAGNPFAGGQLTRESGAIQGAVVERVAAGGYVYLRVIDGRGAEHWLVTLEGPATRALRVDAHLLARAERFESRRLSRAFAPLHFVSLTPSSP